MIPLKWNTIKLSVIATVPLPVLDDAVSNEGRNTTTDTATLDAHASLPIPILHITMIDKAKGWFNRVVHKVDASNLPKVVLELNGKQMSPANCWNATILFHRGGLPKYVPPGDMDQWLVSNTYETSEGPEFGTILVLREGRELKHTAVFINQNILWHKRGVGGKWEFITLKDLKKVYWECDTFTTRRILS